MQAAQGPRVGEKDNGMIKPVIAYIIEMRSKGKRITQEHIDRLLDKMERSGRDVTKNRSGGVCRCGVPYVLKEIDNSVGKYKWYVRQCDCEDL